jgi:hypothetical protein
VGRITRSVGSCAWRFTDKAAFEAVEEAYRAYDAAEAERWIR